MHLIPKEVFNPFFSFFGSTSIEEVWTDLCIHITGLLGRQASHIPDGIPRATTSCARSEIESFGSDGMLAFYSCLPLSIG